MAKFKKDGKRETPARPLPAVLASTSPRPALPAAVRPRCPSSPSPIVPCTAAIASLVCVSRANSLKRERDARMGVPFLRLSLTACRMGVDSVSDASPAASGLNGGKRAATAEGKSTGG